MPLSSLFRGKAPEVMIVEFPVPDNQQGNWLDFCLSIQNSTRDFDYPVAEMADLILRYFDCKELVGDSIPMWNLKDKPTSFHAASREY